MCSCGEGDVWLLYRGTGGREKLDIFTLAGNEAMETHTAGGHRDLETVNPGNTWVWRLKHTEDTDRETYRQIDRGETYRHGDH
jgi:hypothetical protein